VWAHDETRKSFGIAGPRVVEAIKLSLPTTALDGKHPRESAEVADADAALVITPEYNGSIPGVLKNAIDWLSRPWGNGALQDKPLAVIGAAKGRYGGVWAHDETRKSFGVAGPRVVESITLSLPTASLDGKHPRESAKVAEAVREALGKLVAEVS
jgi:NAD(P)H-dependent FMN reductase